jgi:hypothetical protein
MAMRVGRSSGDKRKDAVLVRERLEDRSEFLDRGIVLTAWAKIRSFAEKLRSSVLALLPKLTRRHLGLAA